MDRDVLAAGVVDGLISGLICGSAISAFMFIFIFGGQSGFVPVSEQGYMHPYVMLATPFLLWPVQLGVLFGVVLGLIFSYFNRTVEDAVQLRWGFVYGIVLALPCVASGLLLAPYVDLFHIAIFYGSALIFPVFLFGSLLVWIWNWNWRL